LFENFIKYYKEKLLLSDRLSRAYKMPCRVDLSEAQHLAQLTFPNGFTPVDRQGFLSEIGMRQSPIVTTNLQEELGQREYQCAYYLLEGKTAKEIAQLLHISSRTVEVYIDRLKVRFGSQNKIHLARQLMEAGFFSELT